MRLDKDASEIFTKAYDIALRNKYEYITPEFVLLIAIESKRFFEFLLDLNVDPIKLKHDLGEYLKDINVPRLTEDMAKSLEGEFTKEEILNTIKGCKDSAPGIDGITYSTYKYFWDEVKDIMIE